MHMSEPRERRPLNEVALVQSLSDVPALPDIPALGGVLGGMIREIQQIQPQGITNDPANRSPQALQEIANTLMGIFRRMPPPDQQQFLKVAQEMFQFDRNPREFVTNVKPLPRHHRFT